MHDSHCRPARLCWNVRASPLTPRVLGQPTGSGLIQQKMEQPFFEHFAQHSAMDVKVGEVPLNVTATPATNEQPVLRMAG